MKISIKEFSKEDYDSFFDEAWYVKNNKDVSLSGIDPLDHFLKFGLHESRAPSFFYSKILEQKLWLEEVNLDTLDSEIAKFSSTKLDVSLCNFYVARWYASKSNWKSAKVYIENFLSSEHGLSFLKSDSPLIIYILSLYYTEVDIDEYLDLFSFFKDETNLALMKSIFSDDKLYYLNKLWGKFSFEEDLTKISSFSDLNFLKKELGPITFAFSRIRKVSIIIPCYNSEDHILQVLNSLSIQSWKNLEIIVVDDCSSDKTVDVVKNYILNDRRVKLVCHEKNLGAYHARNTGLAVCTGDYITVHDSDDWSHIDKIKLQALDLFFNPFIKATLSSWVRCTEELVFLSWRIEESLISPNMSSLMFKRQVYNNLGYWDTVSVGGDSEYINRIKKRYGINSIKHTAPSIPLSFGRLHHKSLTQNSITHLRTLFKGIRKDYSDSFNLWHINSKNSDLYLGKDECYRKFKVPSYICRGNISQKMHNDSLIIADSNFFNIDWYLKRYPDIKDSDLLPIDHYSIHGADEGRDPSPVFSTTGYKYIESLPIESNPLVHFIESGKLNYNGLIEGDISFDSSFKTILLCGHLCGETLFGAERSFLDVLSALNKVDLNIIVSLPSAFNLEYIETIKSYCSFLLITPYTWWKKGREVDSFVINVFEGIIKTYNVDLVFCNTITLYEPLIAAKNLNVKRIVHARELPENDEDLKHTLNANDKEIREYILENSDAVIANSHAVSRFINDSSCFTVNNMIQSFDKLNFDLPLGDRLKIGMLSSNLPKKGLYDFVELAIWCESNHVLADFLLFGPKNSYVETLYNNCVLPKNLIFRGYAENSIDAILELDILVNLSNVKESFGRTVLEAMALNRCVISYDWGALSELIKPDFGYLVTYKCIEEVGGIISFLSCNRDVLKRKASKASNIVDKEYSQFAFESRLLGRESPLSKFLNITHDNV